MNNNKKTIYIFGNPLLPIDNMPIKLAPILEKKFGNINFVIKDPNENLEPHDEELVIIDTVINIKKIIIINDIEKIENNKLYSMHDFDLGFNLKLLKKIGKLKKVTIFGIPPDIKKEEALSQLSKLLKKYL